MSRTNGNASSRSNDDAPTAIANDDYAADANAAASDGGRGAISKTTTAAATTTTADENEGTKNAASKGMHSDHIHEPCAGYADAEDDVATVSKEGRTIASPGCHRR